MEKYTTVRITESAKESIDLSKAEYTVSTRQKVSSSKLIIMAMEYYIKSLKEGKIK